MKDKGKTICYNQKNDSLIFVHQKATPEFWDEHWRTEELRKEVISCKYDPFIVNTTKKYCPDKNSRILEGGCGKAFNVYSLMFNGYDTVGIDYAKKTVEAVNRAIPELDVRFGDVRNLDFPDDFFDGYWSIGVIEHYWWGYDQISREMGRVIKPNGFLFLTFPYISPLRKFKIKLGLYRQFKGEIRPSNFYQFALDHKKVAEDFGKLGFQLMEERPFDAINGLKDEICVLKPLLQRLYDYKGNNILTMLKGVISILFERIAAHSILLILKKES